MKKDFLAVSDYSPEELNELIDLATDLKTEYFKHGKPTSFKG